MNRNYFVRGLCWALALMLVLGLMPVRNGSAVQLTDKVSVQHIAFVERDEWEQGDYSCSVLSYSEEEQQSLEEAAQTLRQGMVDRESTISVEVVISEGSTSDLWSLLWDMSLEHTGNPKEGDYIAWHWTGCSGSIGSWTGSDGRHVQLEYYVRYYTTAEQEAELDTAVDNLLAELNLWDVTDYEKVCGIYDYMCQNITYDYDHLGDSSYGLQQTAYAALIHKTSVCQGYASLFYRLALELGVDARVISGTSNGGGHGWNIVKLDGWYYNLDATWDASWYEAGLPYEWYLRCDANFPDHTPDEEYSTNEFLEEYPKSPVDYGESYTGDYYITECGLTLNDLVLGADGVYYTFDGYPAVIAVDAPLYYLHNESLKDWVETYGANYFSLTYWEELVAITNEDGYAPLTQESLVWILDLITGNPAWEEDETYLTYYIGYNLSERTDFGHSFGDWETYVEPTCTEAGEERRYCQCGEYQSRVVEPTGHAYQGAVCAYCGDMQEYVIECGLTLDDLVLGADGAYYTFDGYAAVIAVDVPLDYFYYNTLKAYVEYYGDMYFSLTYWDDLVAITNEDGYAPLTQESLVWILDLITGNPAWEEDETYLTCYIGYCTNMQETEDAMMGDINGDNTVNHIDAMLAAQIYVGLVTEYDLAVADVNGDNTVNHLDAMLIAQFYVEILEEFPAAG